MQTTNTKQTWTRPKKKKRSIFKKIKTSMSEHKYGLVAFLALFAAGAVAVIFTYSRMVEYRVASVAHLRQYTEIKQKYDDLVRNYDADVKKAGEKYYEDKLTRLLTEDELLTLARKQWRYTLTVNNTKLTEDHYYASESFVINFTEALNSRDMPESIQKLGSITGGDELDVFYDHLIIQSEVRWEQKESKNGDATTITYIFNDVPKGSIITLSLSEPLKERLRSQYKDIEIIVN